MAKYALLELHFDDTSFIANAPFSDADDLPGVDVADEPVATDTDEDADTGDTDEDADTGRQVVPAVAVLAVVVVVGYLLRRVLGDTADADVDVEMDADVDAEMDADADVDADL